MTAQPDTPPTLVAAAAGGPVTAGPVRLTPADAGRCRRRVHLDHDPDADRSLRRAPDAGTALHRDTLATHRCAVHDRLSARLPLAEGWTAAGGERPDLIWAPRLFTPGRVAAPDLLVRGPGGGYLPVLIRGHRTTDPGTGATLTAVDDLRPGTSSSEVSTTKKARAHPEDVLALAHIHRMLEQLGLAGRDARGGIIGYGGPAAEPGWDDADHVVWHALTGEVLAGYDERFTDRLAVASAAAGGGPALAQPSRIAECRRCPWWTVCGPELAAAHDVSLLAAGGDADILRAAGAITYDDVAGMDPSVIRTLPLTSVPRGEVRVRARAMVAGVPLVRRRDRIDPVRADVELDVDMESFGDDGAYLWGTYLTGTPPPGYQAGYRPFVTWEPLDGVAAGENFIVFWRHLSALRRACEAAGLSFAAFCYSHAAEERWLHGTPARFPDVPGMPTAQHVSEFCRSGQWVDVYTEVRRLFIVPGSMRLKALAPVAGFTWRDPEPGGENSMAWYRAATGGDDGVAEAYRRRILRYNEDDVRATLALRRWMSDGAAGMPTAAELDVVATAAR